MEPCTVCRPIATLTRALAPAARAAFRLFRAGAWPRLGFTCRFSQCAPAAAQKRFRGAFSDALGGDDPGSQPRAQAETPRADDQRSVAFALGPEVAISELSCSQTGSTRWTDGSASQRRVSSHISCLPGENAANFLVEGDLPRDRHAAMIEADQCGDRLVADAQHVDRRRGRSARAASPRCARIPGSRRAAASAVPRRPFQPDASSARNMLNAASISEARARRHEADGDPASQSRRSCRSRSCRRFWLTMRSNCADARRPCRDRGSAASAARRRSRSPFRSAAARRASRGRSLQRQVRECVRSGAAAGPHVLDQRVGHLRPACRGRSAACRAAHRDAPRR